MSAQCYIEERPSRQSPPPKWLQIPTCSANVPTFFGIVYMFFRLHLDGLGALHARAFFYIYKGAWTLWTLTCKSLILLICKKAKVAGILTL
jgi:hypothetical protein